MKIISLVPAAGLMVEITATKDSEVVRRSRIRLADVQLWLDDLRPLDSLPSLDGVWEVEAAASLGTLMTDLIRDRCMAKGYDVWVVN